MIGRVTVVTSAEELYRQLARDFNFMARSLPSGENRSAYLNAAEEWERRADQEGGALTLKKLEHPTRVSDPRQVRRGESLGKMKAPASTEAFKRGQ